MREHDERPDTSSCEASARRRGTVPVIEERVDVVTRPVETERVRIDKTVTAREVEVDEALLASDVRVERKRLDPPRVVDTPPNVRTDGDTTVVPVLEERLVVAKQLVVTEELLITRVSRRIHARQRVSLRSEHVSVERNKPGHASSRHSSAVPSTSAMPKETIMDRMLVGIFDTKQQMDTACRDLQDSGIPNDRVHVHAGTAQETLGASEFAKDDAGERGTGFFDRLFGRVPEGDRHARLYSEAVRRGGYVVAIDGIDDDRVDEAVHILERDGAYDIDERAAKWRESGWRDEDRVGEEPAGEVPAATIASPPTGAMPPPNTGMAGTPQNLEGREEMKIPVVEEQLNVGKREVQRGGVRIFTHTTERPVEEDVTLREEHARVERRPVDRPATEAELGNAFEEKSVELRETAEEPVVAKTARVIEEVDVAKEVSTRTEKVRDTVRRRDVEVEQLPEDLPQSRAGSPPEGTRPPGRR